MSTAARLAVFCLDRAVLAALTAEFPSGFAWNAVLGTTYFVLRTQYSLPRT